MALSGRHLLDPLSWTPFVDSTDLASILGEPHATVHRALTGLLADGIASCGSHGTAHVPSSQRHYLTVNGIHEAARGLLPLQPDFPSKSSQFGTLRPTIARAWRHGSGTIGG